MMQMQNDILVDVIRKACSQDPATVKEAESNIQKLEVQPGYCLKLLSMVTNYTLDTNMRFMASVCLKNGIDKYWRKTAPNSLKEEERQLLKNQFLQYLNEPELRLARQMSVILGKLARFELPHQWPDLVTKLIQILQESSALAAVHASPTNTPGPMLASLLALAPSSSSSTSSVFSLTPSTSSYSLTNINSPPNIIHNRSLMALHQIIKSLASKRLVNDRKIFEELSMNLIEMLTQLAFFYVQKCLLNPIGELEFSSAAAAAAVDDSPLLKAQLQEHYFFLDQSIICLKILHKLVLHGFKDNAENVFLNQLVGNLMQSFDKFLTKYNRIVGTNQQILIDFFKEKYEYIIVLYVDILHDFHETYPFNFIGTCMSDCLNLIMQVCFTPSGKQLAFPKLCINFMNLLKSVIMCDKYKKKLVKLDDQQLQFKQQKAIEIKQAYLTKENLEQILGFLFKEYLLMTEEELDLWVESPEEFINEDGTATDAWKYNYRACAETLFQAFVHEYHDLVVPIVLELIQIYTQIKPGSVLQNGGGLMGNNNNNKLTVTSNNTLMNGNSNNNNNHNIHDPNQLNKACIDRYVLLKDAAYNCASIAAWELVSHIDFDVWFSQALLPEFNEPACHLLIKRRILILIANWVNIKLAGENRILCYELLCRCLSPGENLVTRLQASLTLKSVLDDIHFDKETYLPYLSFHFGLLCQLLREVEDCDTKIKVLSVLSFLIERVDIHIRPFCAQLADYLPFLWQESADHNMLRCSIVTAFHHLVKSFGAQSVSYHAFLIPVIHYSTDSTQPASVYLLEDGLELWNITVQNSSEMSIDLLKLFANIKPLLDRDTDIWKLCLEIIDSYVILDGRQLFEYYGEFLVNKCCELLNESIKIDALLRLMRSIGHMFEVPANNKQIELFEPFLLKAMNLALNPDVYPMTVAICLSMLARPVLQDSLQFMKIIEKCSVMLEQSPEKILGTLLDSWIDKIDMIVHSERRKLTALALMSLLRFNSNVIFERFGSIINVSVTVMLDVLKEENGVKYDCLLMGRDVENDDEEVDTENEKRKRRIRLLDPVYSVSLRDYCLEKLRECETTIGVENFQQLMNSVEKTVVQKLNESLN